MEYIYFVYQKDSLGKRKVIATMTNPIAAMAYATQGYRVVSVIVAPEIEENAELPEVKVQTISE